MRSRFIPLTLVAATSVFAFGFKMPETNKQYPEFRPHMQSLYSSVVQVLPFLVREEGGLSKAERDSFELQLKNLSEQSKTIKDIAAKSDTGHRLLAGDLSKYASAAYTQMHEGHMNQARFFLSDVVNTCFSCHTSRASSSDSKFAVNFTKDVKWENFDPLAKARFLALSRQFDESAAAYQSLFTKNNLSQDDLVNLDPLVEYMILSIRVRNKPEEVVKTLEALKTSAYPELIKNDVGTWLKSLKAILAEKAGSDVLEEAKKQLDLAKKTMEYPQDRSGLVRYIVASRLLHEAIDNKSLEASKKADAYYLLGLCESVIGSNFLSDESLAYFEQAIRLAPRTDVARKAFAQYEELIRFGYSGSGGTKIPDDEKQRITELKKIAY